MTPSLRKLLVVPAFIAVSLACGAYEPPTSFVPQVVSPQASPPVTYYYQPVTNGQGQTTYVVRTAQAPSGLAGTVLSAVDGKLHLQGADGSRSTCEKLTILVKDREPIQVAIGTQRCVDKQTFQQTPSGHSGKLVIVSRGCLQLTSGTEEASAGDFLKATAQKVSRVGPEGATLVLEGNAKLVYVRGGKKIDVSTELLSVNLMTGQVISELELKPVTPIVPCSVTGSCPAGPPVGTTCPSTQGIPEPLTPSMSRKPTIQWLQGIGPDSGIRY